MPTFPRTVMPREPDEPRVPLPLVTVTARGRSQVRAEDRAGRTWEERWPALKAQDADVRELLATIRHYTARGIVFDVTHPTAPGSGLPINGDGQESSGPVVSGAGQAGLSLDTTGWAADTTVLRAGDFFSVDGLNPAFEVRADAVSDGNGDATIQIDMPILAGSEPADGAALSFEGMTFRARIEEVTLPTGSPAARPARGFLAGLRVTFREMI